MILPNKHLTTEESILGSGAVLLKALSRPQTVSSLWDKVKKQSNIGGFERFTLVLTFLFTIGAIEYSDAMIQKTAHDS